MSATFWLLCRELKNYAERIMQSLGFLILLLYSHLTGQSAKVEAVGFQTRWSELGVPLRFLRSDSGSGGGERERLRASYFNQSMSVCPVLDTVLLSTTSFGKESCYLH